MKATIWHNPRCSKSRAALALLEAAGAEVTLFEYLRTPPTRDEIARLYAKAGMTPREGLRMAEDGASLLGNASGSEIIDAMAASPALIERPLVETAKGVRLCRPPERIADIL